MKTLPLLTLGVGLAAGFWIGRAPQKSAARAAAVRATPAAPAGVSVSETSAERPAVTALLPVATSAERDATLLLALARASAAELAACAATLASSPPCPQRDRDRRAMYEAWARRDPAAALASASRENNASDRQALLDAVTRGWVLQDPAAALAWIAAPGHLSHAVAACESLATVDPAAALQFACALPGDRASLTAAAAWAAIAAPAANGNFEESRQLVASVGATQLQSLLAGRLADTWVRYDPAAAAEWLTTLPASDSRTELATRISGVFAALQPQAAAEFAARVSDPDLQQQLVASVITQWSSTDVVAASHWLDRLGALPQFDPAMARIATDQRLIERNPQIALSWAENIVGETVRLDCIRQIATQWAMRDGEASTRYLRTTAALTSPQRAEILSELGPRASAGPRP